MTLNQVYRELVEFKNSVKKIKELTPSESPGSGSTIPVWSPSLNLDVQVALSSLFDGINPRVIISGERFLFKQLNNLNEDAIEVDDVIQTLLPNGSLFTGRYLGGNDQDYLNTNVYAKISADYGLQEVTDNSPITDNILTLPGIKTLNGQGFKFFLDNGETKDISDIEDALGLVYTLDDQDDSKALAAPVGQIILDALALKIEEETDPTVPQHVKDITEQDIIDLRRALQIDDVINNLDSDSSEKVLSAKQGKVLRLLIDSALVNSVRSLSGNQTDSTISILDADGNVIDTLPVGWLNNEATKFEYNPDDQTLDLKNDDGTLLSQIPVSAFLANIANNLFKSGTSIQMRDSTNAVLSSVDLDQMLGVSNINGLVSALFGKFDKTGGNINGDAKVNGILSVDGAVPKIEYYVNNVRAFLNYATSNDYWIKQGGDSGPVILRLSALLGLVISGNVTGTGFKTPTGTGNLLLDNGNIKLLSELATVDNLAKKVDKLKLKTLDGISLIGETDGEDYVLPKELPVGKLNQIPRISTDLSSSVRMGYSYYEGIIVDTEQDLANAKDAPFPTSEIFKKWTLISHADKHFPSKYPSPPNFPGFVQKEGGLIEAGGIQVPVISQEDFILGNIWQYDDQREWIYLTNNYDEFTGYISPETYGSYLFKCDIGSRPESPKDDDYIVMIMAFVIDPETGYQHTLSAVRTFLNNGFPNPDKGTTPYNYRIVYNFGQVNEQTIVDASNLAPESVVVQAKRNWKDVKSAFEVSRNGNVFNVKTSQFTEGAPVIDNSTLVTININSFPILSIFNAQCSFGIGARSQAGAYFSNLKFPGLKPYIIDIIEGTAKVWKYDEPTFYYTVDPTLMYNDLLEVNFDYWNGQTRKMFAVTHFGIKPYSSPASNGTTSPTAQDAGDFQTGTFTLTDDAGKYGTVDETVTMRGEMRYLGGSKTLSSSWANYGVQKVKQLSEEI